MAAACGLTIVKRFTYRDDATEEWSSVYWLQGTAPQTYNDWQTLALNVMASEAPLYLSYNELSRALGYDVNDKHAHAVYTEEWAPGAGPKGNLAPVAGAPGFAGDQAALVRWKTSRKNTRGKWIYLRKYIHGGLMSGTDIDKIHPSMLTALDDYALAWEQGINPTGRKLTSRFQATETLASATASPWITTRTLKRRGKRP